MNVPDDPGGLYQALRRACLEDPLGGRRLLLDLLERPSPLIEAVLARAGGPDGARVRQVVARVLAGQPLLETFATTLEEWRVRETDEFTRVALDDALASTLPQQRRGRTPTSEMEDLAGPYEYLAGRLRHRVLNALPPLGPALHRLREGIEQGASVVAVLGLLDEVAAALARVPNAVDLDREVAAFRSREIPLVGWIEQRARSVCRQRPGLTIDVDADERARRAIVRGNDFLLETIFDNLWTNCLEAAPAPCRVSLRVRVAGDAVRIDVLDNGPGMTVADAERAFKFAHSSKRDRTDRGRGHMEIAEAMRRMSGLAAIESLTGSGLRVVLRFARVGD